MIKEFEKNLTYSFSKEKFKEALASSGCEEQLKKGATESEIINKLNGHEVEVLDKNSGKIPVILGGVIKLDICILPIWCEAWWKVDNA